jgi:ferritin
MRLKTNTQTQDQITDARVAKTEVNVMKRRICTLSDKMVELLVRQLQHELYNHNLYRTFANFYGTQGLAVLEQYYIDRAEEEKLHHDWIYGYLNENDAIFIYPEIPGIVEKWDDNIKPFALTVDKEIETTGLIYDMVNQAVSDNDWATFNWLNGDDEKVGRLVQEQVEEESISRTALDIAEEEGSWLRKEKSIMNAYKGDTD